MLPQQLVEIKISCFYLFFYKYFSIFYLLFQLKFILFQVTKVVLDLVEYNYIYTVHL